MEAKVKKKGSARVTIKIVEESEEGEEVEDEPALPVPDTDRFTCEGSSVVMVDSISLIAVTVGVIAAAWLLTKQAERE